MITPSKESVVIASTPQYTFQEQQLQSGPTHAVGLSYRKWAKSSDPIQWVTFPISCKDVVYSGKLMKLELEAQDGRKTVVTTPVTTNIYTRFRGVIPARKLNLADVLVDERGHFMKITNATVFAPETSTVVTQIQAPGLFCCVVDGLLVGTEYKASEKGGDDARV